MPTPEEMSALNQQAQERAERMNREYTEFRQRRRQQDLQRQYEVERRVYEERHHHSIARSIMWGALIASRTLRRMLLVFAGILVVVGLLVIVVSPNSTAAGVGLLLMVFGIVF